MLLKVTGRSKALEQENGHQSPVEMILAAALIRESDLMINCIVFFASQFLSFVQIVVANDAMIWLNQYGFGKLYRRWLWFHYWLRWKSNVEIFWKRRILGMTWEEIETTLD